MGNLINKVQTKSLTNTAIFKTQSGPSNYPKFIQNAAKASTKFDLPLLSFFIGFSGDIVSLLINAQQTAKNPNLNLDKKIGIVSLKEAKPLSFPINLLVYLAAKYLPQSYLKFLPAAEREALSQLFGMVISFVFNDLFNPMIEAYLASKLAISGIAEKTVKLFANK